MKNLKKSEKRKSTRQDCLVPVDGKKGSYFAHMNTIDFSEGGIGLISDQKIPLNKEVPMEVEFSPNADPLIVIGKVKWVQEVVDSHTHKKSYRIGLTFKDVHSGSKSAIQEYFHHSV